VFERQDEIAAMPAGVLLVAYDEPTLLEAKMLHDMALPFPLALDRSRATYARWGLGRTNLFGAMLSPSLNWRYLRLLLAGERFLGFAPDMFQLGATSSSTRSGPSPSPTRCGTMAIERPCRSSSKPFVLPLNRHRSLTDTDTGAA
jgi:hypothetical protein